MAVKILVTGNGTYISQNETGGLIIGAYYDCEPADSPTNKQNAAFHALCQTFWTSGLHSYPAKSFKEFREYIKRDLGAGAEYYVYVKKDSLLKGKSKDKEEAIREAAIDRDGHPVVWMKLKSWADYTKRERTETIDRLIATMHQAGVQTKKFYEILTGMEENSAKRYADTGALADEAIKQEG
jgi:hypothetical protein